MPVVFTSILLVLPVQNSMCLCVEEGNILIVELVLFVCVWERQTDRERGREGEERHCHS